MLAEWIEHRMNIVRVYSRAALVERSGISREKIDELLDGGDLAELIRSEQRDLASILRVSLKQLWAVAEDGEWVDDSAFYDAVGTAPPPGKETDWQKAAAAAEAAKGTPAIADILADGRVDLDLDWNQWLGRRLPYRFGNGRMVYAFGFRDRPGEYVVLRDMQPHEMAMGNRYSLFVSDGFDWGEGFYARVYNSREFGKYRLKFDDGETVEKPRDMVLRVGRKLAVFPPPEGESVPEWAKRAQNDALGGEGWEIDSYSQSHPDYEASYDWDYSGPIFRYD